MHSLLADLKHALRSLRQRPLLPLVAALSVAIGIGVNTTVVSVVNALLVRPMPGITNAASLVEVGRSTRGEGFDTFAYPDFLDLRGDTAIFAQLAAFSFQSATVSIGGESRRLMGMTTSANYLTTLGVKPVEGRFFAHGEDVVPGQNPVVVISHRLWQDVFGGAPDVVGKTLVLSRVPFTVIGVAPPGFYGHIVGIRPDFYVPISMGPTISRESARWFTSRASMSSLVIGRLAPGVSRQRADVVVREAMTRLAREYPVTNADRNARVAVLGPVPEGGRPAVAAFTTALSAIVALILVVVCANVAGMLLARAATRRQEIAMRVVLGSPRGRIIRQVVFEALAIFSVGGLGGLLIAMWGTSALSALHLPVPVEVVLNLRPDLGVLAIGFGVALATGLVFGLIPALQVSNPALASVIKDLGGTGGPRAGRVRRTFVAVQVAASVTLLAAAGLFLRAINHAATEPIGFNRDGVYMTTANLTLDGFNPEEGLALQVRLMDRLGTIPGATSVALATDLPLDVGSSGESVVFEDRAPGGDSTFDTDFNRVSATYFTTLDLAVRRGRGFTRADGPLAPHVAVVDSTFAARVWPGAEALGRRFRLASDSVTWTVVGVVDRTPNQRLGEVPRPELYLPIAQSYAGSFHVLVRGAAGMHVPAGIRPAVRELDRDISTTPVVSLRDYTSIAILPQRLAAALIAALGGLALLLCALGVYGLAAHDVSRRMREFGVRVAIGAQPKDVVRLVYRSAMRVALPGAVIGAALALGLSQALRSFLLGLDPLDPVALLVAIVALVAATLVACAMPARRAMRVEPMRSLREE